MNWHDQHNKIPLDDLGHPKFRGALLLTNDKNEDLASICWFSDDGPFYAHAVDLNEPNVMRRIGPVRTLEMAKQCCLDAIEGKIKSLNRRAGYER